MSWRAVAGDPAPDVAGVEPGELLPKPPGDVLPGEPGDELVGVVLGELPPGLSPPGEL